MNLLRLSRDFTAYCQVIRVIANETYLSLSVLSLMLIFTSFNSSDSSTPSTSNSLKRLQAATVLLQIRFGSQINSIPADNARRRNIFRAKSQLIAKLNNWDKAHDNSFITKIIILKSVVCALITTMPLQCLNSSRCIHIHHNPCFHLKCYFNLSFSYLLFSKIASLLTFRASFTDIFMQTWYITTYGWM